MLTFIYLCTALFGYLSFYDNIDIKTMNMFAFYAKKDVYFIFINFGVAFSVLFSIIVTFKPTKDLIMSYFVSGDEEDNLKMNIICTFFLKSFLITISCLLVIF